MKDRLREMRQWWDELMNEEEEKVEEQQEEVEELEQKEESPVSEEEKVLSQVYVLILDCDNWCSTVIFNVFGPACDCAAKFYIALKCSRNGFCDAVAAMFKLVVLQSQLIA